VSCEAVILLGKPCAGCAVGRPASLPMGCTASLLVGCSLVPIWLLLFMRSPPSLGLRRVAWR